MTSFRFDDPNAYVQGTPFDALARLRAAAPFAWHRTSGVEGDGFWLALKHADVVAISKAPHAYSTHAPLLGDPLPRELWSAYPSLAMISDNLMTFDPERHARVRPLANTVFSASRLASMEGAIRKTCVEAIEAAADRPRFDFAETIALRVPIVSVLGRCLGVAPGDLDAVARDVLTINAMDDPVFRPRREALRDAAEALCAHGLSLLHRLETQPDDSLLSDLVHANRDGISAKDWFLIWWFPLAAGAFDTTASTIAGGVRALLQHRDQLDRLRADPRLVPAAVDEMVRWVSPVIYFRRTATMDGEYRGQRIRKGDKLVLCYASANRDEDVFPDADVFDVTRTRNEHVSFGYGPHFCLGARVSALLLRIFFDEFLTRMGDLEIDGPVVHTRSCWMNRIRSMPVSRV